MQNLVVLMDPPDRAWDASAKGGRMIFNRFCIDEDAGFELSGVSRLKNSSSLCFVRDTITEKKARKVKGKEYCDLILSNYFDCVRLTP